MAFKRITGNQLTSVRELFKFLHRLRVIGTVRSRIERIPLTEFGKPVLFTMHYKDYDPSTKNQVSFEDELDRYFSKRASDQDIYNE